MNNRGKEGNGYDEVRRQLQEKKPQCPVDLEPMEQWISKDIEFCRPCILPITIDWYRQQLAEAGHPELIEELDKARMTEDPDATCRVMDAIKDKVPLGLKYRLMEFDCDTQVHAAEMEDEIIPPPDEAFPEPSPLPPDSSGIESESPPETSLPELQETEQ